MTKPAIRQEYCKCMQPCGIAKKRNCPGYKAQKQAKIADTQHRTKVKDRLRAKLYYQKKRQDEEAARFAATPAGVVCEQFKQDIIACMRHLLLSKVPPLDDIEGFNYQTVMQDAHRNIMWRKYEFHKDFYSVKKEAASTVWDRYEHLAFPEGWRDLPPLPCPIQRLIAERNEMEAQDQVREAAFRQEFQRNFPLFARGGASSQEADCPVEGEQESMDSNFDEEDLLIVAKARPFGNVGIASRASTPEFGGPLDSAFVAPLE